MLDEADEMLDLGFRDELEFILSTAPEDRRTLLFSATIAREIAMLARRFQRNALRIDTVDRSQPHQDIEYRGMRIDPNMVEAATVNTLRLIDQPAIIFCARRDGVRAMADALIARGFTAVALSGELSQQERNNALQAVRDGRARVCVATDVAARGLDLPDLGLVIHADLPTNKETLLHRSGRTGRAGRARQNCWRRSKAPPRSRPSPRRSSASFRHGRAQGGRRGRDRRPRTPAPPDPRHLALALRTEVRDGFGVQKRRTSA